MSMQLEILPVTNFAEIEKMAKEGYIYVINNTDNGGKQNRGNFSMTIKDEAGDAFSVLIPATWVPQDLASFCDTSLFMRSMVFRSAVSSGSLLVMKKQDAQDIMARPEAKAETIRIREYTSGIKQFSNAPVSQDATVSIRTNTASHVSELTSEMANRATSADDQALINLVGQFNAGNVTEETAIEQLKRLTASAEILKDVATTITKTNSHFYEMIGQLISTAPSNGEPYRGPRPPSGFNR